MLAWYSKLAFPYWSNSIANLEYSMIYHKFLNENESTVPQTKGNLCKQQKGNCNHKNILKISEEQQYLNGAKIEGEHFEIYHLMTIKSFRHI